MSALTYNHQTVQLDGGEFSDSEFSHCRLVYSGGALPQIARCRFNDCEWTLQGAAADTLAFLKLMWAAGAKTAVQSTIKDITVASRSTS